MLDCRLSLRLARGNASTSMMSGCSGTMLVTANPTAPTLLARYASIASHVVRCSQNRQRIRNPVTMISEAQVQSPYAKM